MTTAQQLLTNAPDRVRSDEQEPVTPAAYHKVFRTFVLIIGLAGISLGVLNRPRIFRELELLPLWWSIPALTAVFATALVLALTAYLAPIPFLRILLRIHSIGYVVALLSWPLAYSGPPLEDFGSWLWSVNALAAMVSAAAWSPRIALPYLALVPAGSVLLNAYAERTPDWGLVCEEILLAATAATIYVSMAVIGLNTGWRLDQIKASARSRAAKAAATAARNQERERIDGLIHDGVIATLLNASQGGNVDVLARQSRRTLEQIDKLRDGHTSEQELQGAEAVAYIRASALDICEDVPISVDLSRAPDFTVPAEVVRAIGAGLAEALTNSLRHAGERGRPVDRRVEISVAQGSVCASISDNGRGFDPRTVPADRLGLAVSIRGRMGRLPGGSSRLDSEPGRGTTIVLQWQQLPELSSDD